MITITKEEYKELLRAKEQYDKYMNRIKEYQLRNRKRITEYHNTWERKRRKGEI